MRDIDYDDREQHCVCTKEAAAPCVFCDRQQRDELARENRHLRDTIVFVRDAVVLGLESTGHRAPHSDPVVKCMDEALAGRL